MRENIYLRVKHTFEVLPEQEVFTLEHFTRYPDTLIKTSHEEAVRECSQDTVEVTQRVLAERGCKLLEIEVVESSELAYRQDQKRNKDKFAYKRALKKQKTQWS